MAAGRRAGAVSARGGAAEEVRLDAVETMETHLARVEANLLGSIPAAATG